MQKQKQLVLSKGVEQFIFRYSTGCEDELISTFIENAQDENKNFDWFDAAVLSFKLTQSLICQADDLLDDNLDKCLFSNLK